MLEAVLMAEGEPAPSTSICGKYLRKLGKVRRPPSTPCVCQQSCKPTPAGLPYLVVTKQCEIDARNHRNGDVEPRASQAVELLHGGFCPWEIPIVLFLVAFLQGGNSTTRRRVSQVKYRRKRAQMTRDGYRDQMNLHAGVAARG